MLSSWPRNRGAAPNLARRLSSSDTENAAIGPRLLPGRQSLGIFSTSCTLGAVGVTPRHGPCPAPARPQGASAGSAASSCARAHACATLRDCVGPCLPPCAGGVRGPRTKTKGCEERGGAGTGTWSRSVPLQLPSRHVPPSRARSRFAKQQICLGSPVLKAAPCLPGGGRGAGNLSSCESISRPGPRAARGANPTRLMSPRTLRTTGKCFHKPGQEDLCTDAPPAPVYAGASFCLGTPPFV